MKPEYTSIELTMVPVPLPPEREEAYWLAIGILVDLINEYLESEQDQSKITKTPRIKNAAL